MKVKIKDLTLEQIQNFCGKSKDCNHCVLFNWRLGYCGLPMDIDKDDLESEIEVDE